MNHRMYIDLLKSHLQQSVEKRGLSRDYIFTQDNDSKHTALNTKLWILYNTPHWMETPPQSPDINPIENLWHQVEQNIRKYVISMKHHPKQKLITEWGKISSQTTKSLMRSIPKKFSWNYKEKKRKQSIKTCVNTKEMSLCWRRPILFGVNLNIVFFHFKFLSALVKGKFISQILIMYHL